MSETIKFEKLCPGNYKVIVLASVNNGRIEGALLNGWHLEPGTAIMRDLQTMLDKKLDISTEFKFRIAEQECA